MSSTAPGTSSPATAFFRMASRVASKGAAFCAGAPEEHARRTQIKADGKTRNLLDCLPHLFSSVSIAVYLSTPCSRGLGCLASGRVLYTAAACRRQHLRPRCNSMRDRWLLLLALFLLMMPSGRAQKPNRAKSSQPRGSNPWVEATLRKMTLREKLGQLLMVYFYGQFASTESAAYRQLLHEGDENKVGG